MISKTKAASLFIRFWPVVVIMVAVLAAFYPSILMGKIPFNGNNLVGFYSPWVYETWEGYPAGVPSIPEIPDQSRIYFPYMSLTQQSYRLGQLPLWNPYNFGGNPHMAEWQSGVFYPFHVLLPFLSLNLYWTLFQMIGLFLAGVFTYAYVKNLGLNRLSALFGGLTFTFSTFMFSWNTEVITAPHSILWLPLMLYLVDKFLVSKQHKYWLLLILAGAFSVLSGYWQTTFYTLGFVAVYIIVRSYLARPRGLSHSPRPKKVLALLLIFPLIILLTSFHLLPTWELYNRSSRPILSNTPKLLENHKTFLLKPHRIITYLAPDFFGHPATRNQFSFSNRFYYEWSLFIGTVPIIILPFIALSKRKRLKKLFWTLLGLGVVAGSFAFDFPHSRLVFDSNIPILSTSIANRILFIPTFVLSLISAFALDSWLKSSPGKRKRYTLTTLLLWLVVFASLWFFLLKLAPEFPIDTRVFPETWYKISLRNSIIPTGVFLAAACVLLVGIYRKKFLTVLIVLLIVGSTAQNLYQFFKFTPFTETRFIYPLHPTIKFLQENAGINRYLGYNGLFLNYNFATKLGIYTLEGYDSLNDRNRTQLFFAAQNQGKLTQYLNTPVDVIMDRNVQNPRNLRLMQLTGIKYFVDHSQFPDSLNKDDKPTLPDKKLDLVFTYNDWKIYQYLDAFPRAFMIGDYIVETNDQKTADLVFNPEINLRQTVILNQNPSGISPKPDPSASVQVSSYTPNKITFETSSSEDQLLFLSDTYYPGWKAKIDGRKAQVLAANFAFRALAVPAGDHLIEMYFLPKSFTNGLIVAGITLSLVYLLTRHKTLIKPKDQLQ